MQFRLCLVWLCIVGFQGLYGQTIESYRTCQDCHAQTAAEWKVSRHALSSVEKNPLYRLVRERVKGRDVKGCDVCHQPIGQMGLNDYDARKLLVEGINCDVCHAAKPAKSGGWEIIPGNVKLSPHKDAVPVSHKSVYSKFLVSSKSCLSCHGGKETKNAVCSSEAEYRKSEFAAKGVTCQDCHMPVMEGKTTELGKIREVHTHVFYGAYNAEILRNCADVQMTLTPSADELVVTVKVSNRTVGHALPGGSPLRLAALRLQAFDDAGGIVWQNYYDSPYEDPKALFARLYAAEGADALTAPWEGVPLRADQRLKPKESRTIIYSLPKENVHHITAALDYFLIAPFLAERFGLPQKPYATPVTIVTVSQSLNEKK